MELGNASVISKQFLSPNTCGAHLLAAPRNLQGVPPRVLAGRARAEYRPARSLTPERRSARHCACLGVLLHSETPSRDVRRSTRGDARSLGLLWRDSPAKRMTQRRRRGEMRSNRVPLVVLTTSTGRELTAQCETRSFRSFVFFHARARQPTARATRPMRAGGRG